MLNYTGTSARCVLSAGSTPNRKIARAAPVMPPPLPPIAVRACALADTYLTVCVIITIAHPVRSAISASGESALRTSWSLNIDTDRWLAAGSRITSFALVALMLRSKAGMSSGSEGEKKWTRDRFAPAASSLGRTTWAMGSSLFEKITAPVLLASAASMAANRDFPWPGRPATRLSIPFGRRLRHSHSTRRRCTESAVGGTFGLGVSCVLIATILSRQHDSSYTLRPALAPRSQDQGLLALPGLPQRRRLRPRHRSSRQDRQDALRAPPCVGAHARRDSVWRSSPPRLRQAGLLQPEALGAGHARAARRSSPQALRGLRRMVVLPKSRAVPVLGRGRRINERRGDPWVDASRQLRVAGQALVAKVVNEAGQRVLHRHVEGLAERREPLAEPAMLGRDVHLLPGQELLYDQLRDGECTGRVRAVVHVPRVAVVERRAVAGRDGEEGDRGQRLGGALDGPDHGLLKAAREQQVVLHDEVPVGVPVERLPAAPVVLGDALALVGADSHVRADEVLQHPFE